MCFWESRRTMNDGTFTICLPTLYERSVSGVRWAEKDMCIPDVTLTDQDTSVVDGLGETKLVDASLKTTLQEILNLEGQDVIELHAGLIEHTDTNQTTNEGISFEETLWVLLVEGKKLTVDWSASDMTERGRRDVYRAARRILERVSWTRHTSRLLRRPYSPTIFNSESLCSHY